MKYKPSVILNSVQDCISSKACHSAKERLTQDKVSDELRKDCNIISDSFPKSWSQISKDGERVAEPIFVEIEIIINIVGTHLDEMIAQCKKTKENKAKRVSTLPSSANTETTIIKGNMMTPPAKTTHNGHFKSLI